MNKSKLAQIIFRDLEELKMLAEEVALAEGDSTLIIDLAVSKAKLVCQEIELLREFSGSPSRSEENDEESDQIDEEENEVSNFSISDPELEIINFEDREFPEEETIEAEHEAQEEQIKDEEISEQSPESSDIIEDNEMVELAIDHAEDEDESDISEPEESEDENDLDIEEDELEEDDEEDVESDDEDSEDDEEENDKDDDLEEEEDEDKEEDETEPSIQYNELKISPQPGVREIHIEDLDDDDIEPVKISPQPSVTERPVIREIPKPESPLQENPAPEKVVVGESFQKERSINDVMSENKQTETTLTNGPITSLKAAIGLNDRFLFIREIFSNNSDKYNTIIDHLDKLETIQEAVDYLKANLTLQKNETSLKFVDLLKRRFTR